MVLQVSGVGLVCAGNKISEKSPKSPFIAVSFILSLSFALVTVAKAEEPAIGQSLPEFYIGVDNQITLTRGRLFWFLCGNGVYTDSFFSKIVLKVFPSKHFTIL